MISIIGGTYREINYDGITMEIFGSGLRCCKYFLENKIDVSFYTSGNDEVDNYLKQYSKVYSNFKYTCERNEHLITFKYGFALDEPLIYPNILSINKTNDIRHESDNIICYGMLESDFRINGKRVIYDPQTSIKPVPFSEIGQADQLIYVVNWSEAKSISSSDSIDEIKKYFFEVEGVYAFIIKNGPFGATLFYRNKAFKVPSYKTEKVNKIGSGDIFTASFGFFWMTKEFGLEDSVNAASKSTAMYCNSNVYDSSSVNSAFSFEEFDCTSLEEKQVYLASPFFSLSDLILIDKIRTAFIAFGIKVFSPFHDIGLGDEATIAHLDLEGIEDSDIIFCVLDNLDSGTLIETGYSLAREKKMVVYHRTCKEQDLLMLKSGNCSFYNNLTTAIYHTIWSL